MTYFIYILKHPDTLEVFYVGCTRLPENRHKSHILNYTRSSGFAPLFEIIETVTGTATQAIDREFELIKEYSQTHKLQQDTKIRRPGNVGRKEKTLVKEKEKVEATKKSWFEFRLFKPEYVMEKYGVTKPELMQLMADKGAYYYKISSRTIRIPEDQIEKLFNTESLNQ